MSSSETPVLGAVLVDALINLTGWLVSSYLKTDLVYDLLGACAHVAGIIVAYVSTACTGVRARFAAAACMLWAVRLGLFLFTRILRVGRDARMDKFKEDPVKFAVPWFLQSVWVLCNLGPFLALASNGEDVPLSPVDYVSATLWATGFLLEVVADEQKRAFSLNPANKGCFIHTGVWSLSRHPNYFGEILLWWSMAAWCAPAVHWNTAQVLVLLCPAFPTLLLLRVSGIPLLEKAGKKKWGDDPVYREYVQQTSVLVPWLPARLSASARRAA